MTIPDRHAFPTSDTILISAQSAIGGLAEHTHYQAQELARRGFDVVVLCHPDFLQRPTSPLYRRVEILRRSEKRGLVGRALAIAAVAYNRWVLALHALRLRPRFVLMDSASEYFSPLWVWPHLALRAAGRIYLANLHDPVRDRHFGPEWLHRLSLKLLYAMLDGGLVHGPVPPEANLPAGLPLRVAPIGYFHDLEDVAERVDLRARHGIPATAPLVLAFGHVADRKNLDLLIEALVPLPQVHLLVAGSSNNSAQKQVSFYRAFAREKGVADRVHFDDDFIPDAAIPSYFETADIVALTYRSDFVSQSGVLQHACGHRRPVLVSCGPGPLRDTLERFDLGELVAPDSVSEITSGLARMIESPADRGAGFDAYAQTASWRRNIDQLLALEEDVRSGCKVRGRLK